MRSRAIQYKQASYIAVLSIGLYTVYIYTAILHFGGVPVQTYGKTLRGHIFNIKVWIKNLASSFFRRNFILCAHIYENYDLEGSLES